MGLFWNILDMRETEGSKVLTVLYIVSSVGIHMKIKEKADHKQAQS